MMVAKGLRRKGMKESLETGAVLVVIPAYNEEASIRRVVEGVRHHIPAADILVVDDGSVDETSRRLEATGAELLRLPCNLGVGAALEVALQYAEAMGYSYALRLDADGQHDPRDALRLLAAAKQGEADILIGSRFLEGASVRRESAQSPGWRLQTTPIRALGIKLFASMVSILIGQPISDPTCGLRCFNRPAICYLARYHPQDYPEVESMVVLHRAGFRLKEMPVSIYPRTGGVSSISSWKAVYYVFRVMLAVTIASVRSMPNGKPAPAGQQKLLGSEQIPEEEAHVA
jgi:glycosyltransferase involved in cell wall biosynthesis